MLPLQGRICASVAVVPEFPALPLLVDVSVLSWTSVRRGRADCVESLVDERGLEGEVERSCAVT